MVGLITAIHQYEHEYQRMPVSKLAEKSALNNPDGPDFTFGTTRPDRSLLNPAYPPITSYGSPNYETSNAELPLPPQSPPPGKDLPDFNGVWTLPYTPDLARAYRKPLPFTPHGEAAFKNVVGGDDPVAGPD